MALASYGYIYCVVFVLLKASDTTSYTHTHISYHTRTHKHSKVFSISSEYSSTVKSKMTYQSKFKENISQCSFTEKSSEGSSTDNSDSVGQPPALRRRTTATLPRTAAKAAVRNGRAAVSWLKRRATRRSVSNEELSTTKKELTAEPETYTGLADGIGPEQGLTIDAPTHIRRRRTHRVVTPHLQELRQVSARRLNTHLEGIRHISAATYPPPNPRCQGVARKPVPRREEARRSSRGLERFLDVKERHLTGDPKADQETLELARLAADYYSPPQPVFAAEYHLPPQCAILTETLGRSPEAVVMSPHVSPPAFASAASSRNDLIAFTPTYPVDLITFSRDNLLLETDTEEDDTTEPQDHMTEAPNDKAAGHSCVLPCLYNRIPAGDLPTRLDTLIPACGLLVDAKWDRAMARLRNPTTANMIPTVFQDTPDEGSSSSEDGSVNEPAVDFSWDKDFKMDWKAAHLDWSGRRLDQKTRDLHRCRNEWCRMPKLHGWALGLRVHPSHYQPSYVKPEATEAVVSEAQPAKYKLTEYQPQRAEPGLPSAFDSPAPLPRHVQRRNRDHARAVQRSEKEELLWALASPPPLRWGRG